MLASEHPPATTQARLNLVDYQQNAVSIAHFTQHREETGRRHAIAPFALNRLDEDRRHFIGRDRRGEKLVDFISRAVVIQSMHAEEQRTKAALVDLFEPLIDIAPKVRPWKPP